MIFSSIYAGDDLKKYPEAIRKAAEDKAALMAQKADARVQAVNFALREISDKLSVIGDAVDEIRGGNTGDGELADKLAASAAKAIKAMLEGAGWYA